jgi:hypothetical protein
MRLDKMTSQLRSPFILLRKGEHLAHFIPMLRTTPVAMEMYPEPEAVEEGGADSKNEDFQSESQQTT